MTSENYFRLEYCWNCLVILFMLFCTGNSYCVREGDCVILRCPPAVPKTNPNRDPGPIYVIRWTHLEDTYTTVQKGWLDEPTSVSGKFRGRVEVLENGDLKILNAEERLSGTYSCDVYYEEVEDSRSTRHRNHTKPIHLDVFSESVPENCEPVNDCDDDNGGLDEKISTGLIVTGSILGVILVIFASLCIWAQYNKRKTTDNLLNQNRSILYSGSNSAPSSSPPSSTPPPISTVSAQYQNTAEPHYDVIPYDGVHNIKAKQQENEYLDLTEIGVDRQDSGIELDNNSNASHNEKPEKKETYEKNGTNSPYSHV